MTAKKKTRKSATKSDRNQIKSLYDAGMMKVQEVLFSVSSSRQQVRTARESLQDLTSMLLAHTINSIEGRTAILAGLIVELRGVIDSVQVKPPFASAVKDLEGLAATATKLLKGQQKQLME